MLVLETDKSFTNKMCYIEQHTFLIGKLFVEDDLEIVKEIHLPKDGCKSTIVIHLLNTQIWAFILILYFFRLYC